MVKEVTPTSVSREKHLDHMVRVVPFIVMCYAVQCFVIYRMSPTDFSTTSLAVLGGFIICMIAGFITYDLRHQVDFQEKSIQCRFFFIQHTITYEEIIAVEVSDPGQSFASLKIRTLKRKHTYFFVDDADKIKIWLDSKKIENLKQAA